jgi:hypothetical protein
MAVCLMCQVTGQGKWGNFIAQWVPTWLIIGLYNKLVKLESHDRFDHGRDSDSRLTPAAGRSLTPMTLSFAHPGSPDRRDEADPHLAYDINLSPCS